MHGPDGVDYPNIATYHEVEKYKRLVYDHGGNEERPKLFTVTVTFKEELGKTIMHMIMALDTPEAAREIKKHIKKAQGNSTWDRLGEYLEHEQRGIDPFFINRTFEAPIKKVFEMWTNPTHFEKWLPPTGLDMKILSGSIKENDTIFFKMGHSDFSMYGKINYKTIAPVHTLIYVQSFADEKGNKSRHPGAQVFPESMLATVSFTEEDTNTTRVTVRFEAHGDFSQAELAAFVAERAGMTQGWNGSFDKLEDLL